MDALQHSKMGLLCSMYSISMLNTFQNSEIGSGRAPLPEDRKDVRSVSRFGESQRARTVSAVKPTELLEVRAIRGGAGRRGTQRVACHTGTVADMKTHRHRVVPLRKKRHSSPKHCDFVRTQLRWRAETD